MGRLTGKYTLEDIVRTMLKKNSKGVYVECNNLLEAFNEFKKATNGFIYQQRRINITEQNQELVAKYNKIFTVDRKLVTKPDKRCKTGYREEIEYEYTYFGKKTTLKELNKENGGIFISIPIKFETLLDLIPYFTYKVASSGMNKKEDITTMHITISDKSYSEEKLEDKLKYNTFDINTEYYYRHELSILYAEVIKEYKLTE